MFSVHPKLTKMFEFQLMDLLINICLQTCGVSRLRYSSTARWASQNKPTCRILLTFRLRARLFKATEAALHFQDDGFQRYS
jgi:hypothetical protein